MFGSAVVYQAKQSLLKWTQEAGSGWGGTELVATLIGEAEYLEILGGIS